MSAIRSAAMSDGTQDLAVPRSVSMPHDADVPPITGRGPRHLIGWRVWRKGISPLRYRYAKVVAIMATCSGYDYAIVFDGHAADDPTSIRWYSEEDLLPCQ